MKKFYTFLFSLSIVLYLSGAAATYAQSKGAVHTQGPSVSHGSPSKPDLPIKGKSDQHADHTQVENAGKGHQDWETRFQDRLQNDAAFRAKIESLLPAGTNVQTAASGFKNRGQFIAALHVSHNLDIPYDQLKATMLGLDPTTLEPVAGASPKSLGQAIHTLRPDIAETQVQVEVKKADKQTKVTVSEKTNNTS